MKIYIGPGQSYVNVFYEEKFDEKSYWLESLNGSARVGNLDNVKNIIEANLADPKSNGSYTFLMAVQGGYHEMVEYLIPYVNPKECAKHCFKSAVEDFDARMLKILMSCNDNQFFNVSLATLADELWRLPANHKHGDFYIGGVISEKQKQMIKDINECFHLLAPHCDTNAVLTILAKKCRHNPSYNPPEILIQYHEQQKAKRQAKELAAALNFNLEEQPPVKKRRM